MKRMGVAGVLLALVLAGCGGESTDGAAPASVAAPETSAQQTSSQQSSTRQTSSVVTAAQPPAVTPPLDRSEAAETPAGVVPEASTDPNSGLQTGADMPHGEELYAETCQQFIAVIDGLAATGASTREQSATGLANQLQSNPSWSTLPPEDQQEILRGLSAAGTGNC
nr:hypothetical protein [Rhodococcus sp. (in: high G+C Gram-positive bacteria)]